MGGTPPHKDANMGGTPPHKRGGDGQPAPFEHIPDELRKRVSEFPKRSKDLRALWRLVQELCRVRPMSAREIAYWMGRSDRHVAERILPNVRAAGLIAYRYPDEPYRADQAYVATDAEIPEEL